MWHSTDIDQKQDSTFRGQKVLFWGCFLLLICPRIYQFGKPTNETPTNEKKSQLPHQSQLAKITVPKLSLACHVPGFTWLTRPPAPNHMRSVTSKTKKQNLSSEKYFLSHTRCSFRKQYLDLGVSAAEFKPITISFLASF